MPKTEPMVVTIDTHVSLIIYLFMGALILISGLLFLKYRSSQLKLAALNQTKAHRTKINQLLQQHKTTVLQQMVIGYEAQRTHIANDLQNHLGNILAAIKIYVTNLKSDNTTQIKQLQDMADLAFKDMRTISSSLTRSISEEFGLISALHNLKAHLLQLQNFKVEFSATMGNESIGAANEIVAYILIQELVSNVLKHANATKINIQLVYYEREQLLNILVEDNGIGFKIEQLNCISNKTKGICAMENLVEELNGEITIDSNPKSGTTITIDLPIHNTYKTLSHD